MPDAIQTFFGSSPEMRVHLERVAKERRMSLSALCREAVAKDIGYDLSAENNAGTGVAVQHLDPDAPGYVPTKTRKEKETEAKIARRKRAVEILDDLRRQMGLEAFQEAVGGMDGADGADGEADTLDKEELNTPVPSL